MLDSVSGPVLAVLESVSMVAFAVLAYRFYLVARDVGGSRVYYYCFGFLLLSLAQAVMLLSVIYVNPRASLSLYAASSVLSFSGFYAFMLGRRPTQETLKGYEGASMPVAVVWLKSVIAVMDYAAGFMGIVVSLSFKGVARYLVFLIAVSYVIRGSMLASSIVSGSSVLLAIMLAGELARSMAAAVLSIAYILPESERS